MGPTTRSSWKRVSSKPQARRTASSTKRQAPQETPAAEPSQEEAPIAQTSQKTFPCPYANKLHCDETFKTQVEASRHAILSHRVSPVHMTEDGQLVCLYAEPGCLAIFEAVASLKRHLISEHRGKAFPCPLAECCCGSTDSTSLSRGRRYGLHGYLRGEWRRQNPPGKYMGGNSTHAHLQMNTSAPSCFTTPNPPNSMLIFGIRDCDALVHVPKSLAARLDSVVGL